MIYVITNRKLVPEENGGFYKQIERIAKAQPDGIVLREKDLSPEAYEELAVECQKICNHYNVPLIINLFYEVARKLGILSVHLSMPVFKELLQTSEKLKGWEKLGVSVHSVEEAVFAEKNGADYLIAGHIFLTDCKKGLPARGLDYLHDVSTSVEIPVFGIGGMNEEHGALAMKTGASGICMMSELMKNTEPESIIKKFARHI